MNTIYIHMGNLKTGSTAIQAYLFKYKQELLEKHNLLIPQSITYSYTVYSGEPYHIHKGFEEITHEDIEAFVKEIAANPGKDILISNEWYNGVSDKELAFFNRVLPNYQVKVIFYVRRIDSFLKSFFNEQRKRRVMQQFVFYETYIQNGIKYFTDNALFRIKTSVDALGKENVILKLYDRNLLKNNDIICDFFEILGIDIQENPMSNKSINASVEVDSFAYLCAAQSVLSNESIPFYTEQYNRIFHLFLNAQKAIPNLPKDLHDNAIADIHKSIDELESYIPGYKTLYDSKEIDISAPKSSVTPNEAFLASLLCSVSFEIEKIKIQNKIILQRMDATVGSGQGLENSISSATVVNSEKIYTQAKYAFDAGETVNAEKYLVMAMNIYASADCHALMAKIYKKRNMLHISMDCLHKAIKIKNNVEYAQEMQSLLALSKQYVSPENTLQKLQMAEKIALQFAGAKSIFSLLQNFIKNYTLKFANKQKYDVAISFAKNIIKIKPNLAWPHFILGLAYWELGYIYLSMQELEKAKNLDCDDPEISSYYYSKLMELTPHPQMFNV